MAMYARAVYRVQGADMEQHERDVCARVKNLQDYLGGRLVFAQGTTLEPPEAILGTFLECVFMSNHPRWDVGDIESMLNARSDLRYELVVDEYLDERVAAQIPEKPPRSFLQRLPVER